MCRSRERVCESACAREPVGVLVSFLYVGLFSYMNRSLFIYAQVCFIYVGLVREYESLCARESVHFYWSLFMYV